MTFRVDIRHQLTFGVEIPYKLTFSVDIRIAAAGTGKTAEEKAELVKAEAQAKKILSKDKHMVRAFRVDEFVPEIPHVNL